MPLQLARARTPWDIETTMTENVSTQGTRIVTRRHLAPEEQLRVTLHEGELAMEARVVYCQPLPRGLFAVGLWFGESLWARFAAGGADKGGRGP